MATATPIPLTPYGYALRPSEVYVPVSEYLRTVYRPDMDFVDGHLEERNMGDPGHSEFQNALLMVLNTNAKAWGIRVMPECRLQVSAERFRVPDIMVLPREQRPTGIVDIAPLLCIEILSPDDTFRRLQARIDDYVAMGVRSVWVLDPKDGRVFTVAGGRQQFADSSMLTVEGTAVRVDMSDVMRSLED